MRKLWAGFTLIELMVALFIFAIVSMLAISGLRSILQSSAAVSHYDDRLSQLQLAMVMMDRDFSQIVNRPIIAENKAELPAIMGDRHSIQFTRMGNANPMAFLPRGNLQRSAYYLKNQQLIRVTWPVLDRVPTTEATQQVILSNVEAFDVSYIAPKLLTSEIWPSPTSSSGAIPAGIRITIVLKDLGPIERVYSFAGNSNES